MRYILICVFCLLLASCTLGSEKLDTTKYGSGIPPQTKIQSGYTYPVMPLEEYQKLQQSSGSAQ